MLADTVHNIFDAYAGFHGYGSFSKAAGGFAGEGVTMYENNHASHGLMFHHFSDAKHPAGQGAITADQFFDILNYAGTQRILSPETWKEKAVAGRLEPSDLCITFDDALLCQFEIAKPVLDDLGLKAFWFVYSGVFEGAADRLEIYRHYRTVQFENVDDFYNSFFFNLSKTLYGSLYLKARDEFSNSSYLKSFSFYTDEDRFFRYMRDVVLGATGYFETMDHMIESDSSYSRVEAAKGLWMTDAHLLQLFGAGHDIGLHSYSHPTSMVSLNADEQRKEYAENRRHLGEVLGVFPDSMSHPCGSYNDATLELLRDMKVNVGFRSDMTFVNDPLCLPRQDHSNIAIQMGMR